MKARLSPTTKLASVDMQNRALSVLIYAKCCLPNRRIGFIADARTRQFCDGPVLTTQDMAGHGAAWTRSPEWAHENREAL